MLSYCKIIPHEAAIERHANELQRLDVKAFCRQIFRVNMRSDWERKGVVLCLVLHI